MRSAVHGCSQLYDTFRTCVFVMLHVTGSTPHRLTPNALASRASPTSIHEVQTLFEPRSDQTPCSRKQGPPGLRSAPTVLEQVRAASHISSHPWTNQPIAIYLSSQSALLAPRHHRERGGHRWGERRGYHSRYTLLRTFTDLSSRVGTGHPCIPYRILSCSCEPVLRTGSPSPSAVRVQTPSSTNIE